MSTYLVTGGTGRIGTTFVHELAARGHTVRIGTREPAGPSARLRTALGPGRVEAVLLDENDARSLDAGFSGVAGALFVARLGRCKPGTQQWRVRPLAWALATSSK